MKHPPFLHILGFSLLKGLSRMPFWMIYFFADCTYYLMYYVVKYRKKVVFDNLRKSFPSYSEDELRTTAKLFYKNLADIQMEALKGLTISRKELAKRVISTNLDLIEDYTRQGVTSILATSHKCNWEWSLLGSSINFKDTPLDSLYKPLSNKFMDWVMLETRGRFGAYMVADTKVLRSLASRKTIYRTIAMVADQTPAKESPHRLMFLNQPTLFFSGIEKIAVAIQAPIIFADVNRLKRGYYEITYYAMSAPPYDINQPGIVEKYAVITEEAILRQPHNWLWSHKRWKHKLD